MKTKGKGAQATKFLVITYDNSSKKLCVTKKFHVLVVQNNRQKNVQKNVLHVQICIFLLIRSVDFDAVLIAVALKGDVTRDDLQRRFLAQHSVAMLVQCCNNLKQHRNNVATLCCAKNLRCESPRLTSP